MAKKILLIEDEELVIKLLQKKLKNLSYELEVASDGETGLRLIGANPDADLILLDMIMPKKSGFEVLDEVRKDSRLSQIPVMIISNSGQPLELEKAKKYGVRDWLVKTEFDPREVVSKIKAIIGE